MNELKEILKIVKDLDKRLQKIEEKFTSSPETILKPVIKKGSKKSIGGLIMELVDDGFFDTPKAFAEILDELKRRGYYYARTSITLPLQTLLRKKALGRISVGGNWAYVKR